MEQLTPAQLTDRANAILIGLMGDIIVADSRMDELRQIGYSAPTLEQILNRCLFLISSQR